MIAIFPSYLSILKLLNQVDFSVPGYKEINQFELWNHQGPELQGAQI